MSNQPAEPVATVGLVGPGDLWYKDAIIYSLNVETFQDSNGDGVGDFAGLTSRVDYLHGLGITCICLAPFYPSPRRDNRYDVADYYGIDPTLGSLGDFVDFLRVARERGIRVITDLVVNHTSDQHPWFQSARASESSPYRSYYVWADAPPENANEGMVFPGYEVSTWTRDESANAYFFHRFYNHQPDLNLGTPRVREEIRKIMGYWLELGVSGFRIDGAPFLIERKGISLALDETRRPHSFFRYMRGFLSWRRGDAALLAEANVAMEEVSQYVGAGDKLHMLFGFWLNQHLWLALATQRAAPLVTALADLATLPAACQWVNFLRNHDELDLGRLSPDDRQRVYDAFAPDDSMQLYGRGVRRRTASMLGGNRARLELAHSLLLALSGTPVLYYGDEIGMGEDLDRPERECVRTPMQWSSGSGAGFSRAAPDQFVRPVLLDGPYGCASANVADQQRDPASLLNWLRRAIGVRKSCRELSWGRSEVVPTGDDSVLGLACRGHDATLLTLHNLAAVPRPVGALASLFAAELDGARAVEIFADRDYGKPSDPNAPTALAAFGYRWFRIVHER